MQKKKVTLVPPTFSLLAYVVYLLVFLGGALPRDEGDGEFPPLSPPDEPFSSEGPAVTLKSLFSFDMRNSS